MDAFAALNVFFLLSYVSALTASCAKILARQSAPSAVGSQTSLNGRSEDASARGASVVIASASAPIAMSAPRRPPCALVDAVAAMSRAASDVPVSADDVDVDAAARTPRAGADADEAALATIVFRRATTAVVEASASMVRGLRVRVWRRDDDALTSFLIFS